jgi:hypothetical protein
MKQLFLFAILVLTGCSSGSDCPLDPNAQWPLARARVSGYIPLFNIRPSDTANLDVAVVFFANEEIFRRDEVNISGVYASAAFEDNRNPSWAQEVRVNDMELEWQGCQYKRSMIEVPHDQPYSYWLSDERLLTDDHVLRLAYKGFREESYLLTADIVSAFGKFIFEDTTVAVDTIHASKGYTLRYTTAVPGDSIYVSYWFRGGSSQEFVQPDRGELTFQPGQLQSDTTDSYASYWISLTRSHWSRYHSPSGKEIGVVSYYTSRLILPVKP